ncbi:hypothetical protein IWW36_001869 [Coemansia brasiliensis]|uniref:Uncharacterized protein n=1 Tax=Coemansia brasiliensis TaxID=2650707 RepID=A0A9W8LYQ0_9FUNG|nr:hypothetical protein IWW36_001869 [Coemansia brasiliensis]
MAIRNIPRCAEKALRDIVTAENRWHGWSSDALPVANSLVNLILQQYSAQQPSVWHPSLTFMFPDLPAKYEEANVDISKQTLAKLCEIVGKMSVQCANIKAAVKELSSLSQQAEDSRGSAEPKLLYFTLKQYAELAHGAYKLYESATAMRVEYVSDLGAIVRGLAGESATFPPDAFDSDKHFVKLLNWESSPGLKDGRLEISDHPIILTLQDFDELIRSE